MLSASPAGRERARSAAGGLVATLTYAVRMGWLVRLFGRESFNPETQERVRCEACHGTGLWIQRHNASTPNPVGF
jgi:hypothetical protein